MAARGPHTLHFGNPVVHEIEADKGQITGYVPRLDLGKRTTLIELPHADAAPLIASAKKLEQAYETYSREGFLVHLLTDKLELWEVPFKHIAIVVGAHARAGMDWVHCEDEKLRQVLGLFLDASEGHKPGYGDLPALGGGSPEWDVIDEQLRRAGIEHGAMRELIEREVERWPGILARLDGDLTMLKTKAGFTALAKACFGAAEQPAQFKYMAITKNATAPAEADETLAEENTTAGGGLVRREITYGYTEGTKKATSQATFTANASDVATLPITFHKFGLFNKVTSGGTMAVESEITAATLSAEGDNVSITDTITLS